MEMIAAFRMRQAQSRVLAARPYEARIREVIARLSAQPVGEDEDALHPLLTARPEANHIAVVHITPDRGLCGGLDSNLNRVAGEFILQKKVEVSLVCVGRKGRDFMVRSGQNVKAIFADLGHRPSMADVMPIAHMVIKDYVEHVVDEVHIVFADYVSATMQRPAVRQLLPIQPAVSSVAERGGYIYEPDARSVLAALLPRFVEREVYQAVLEAVASEQAARLMAMRDATDNANEMIEELTLLLNKIRQQSITAELLEVVGTAEALD
jgi:F-type H+-transporting ATPase subunit gamma